MLFFNFNQIVAMTSHEHSHISHDPSGCLIWPRTPMPAHQRQEPFCMIYKTKTKPYTFVKFAIKFVGNTKFPTIVSLCQSHNNCLCQIWICVHNKFKLLGFVGGHDSKPFYCGLNMENSKLGNM
jgi:hypothetical protein